jgi:membrane-bound inhibitor of C-type lysozyme
MKWFACLAALMPQMGAAQEFTSQRYTCDRGVEVPATYVTTAGGSLAVINVDGSQITLLQEEAALGARYCWPSDGSNYVWWTKGNDAALYWKTPEGETLLLTCTGM